jgi:uncharacterized membrane protein
MPIFVKEEEKGKTGKVSPGKVIAWFWMVAAIWLSAIYFGFVPWTPVTELTFWQWIIGSFVFGTMSVGFYLGMAKSGFKVIVDALKTRISGK